jgi:hypothetical protein
LYGANENAACSLSSDADVNEFTARDENCFFDALCFASFSPSTTETASRSLSRIRLLASRLCAAVSFLLLLKPPTTPTPDDEGWFKSPVWILLSSDE